MHNLVIKQSNLTMIDAKVTAPRVSIVMPYFRATEGIPVDLMGKREPSAVTEVGPRRFIQRIWIKGKIRLAYSDLVA